MKKAPQTWLHDAHRLRVAAVPPGSWGVSFDASSYVRSGGEGFGEWGYLVKSLASGATLWTAHGPCISEPYCNLYGEWEGLCAGLDWVAKGYVRGLTGLAITTDERTLANQINGRWRVCDSICAGWCDLALGQLLFIGLPWSAVKVSRGANAEADSLAGGGW